MYNLKITSSHQEVQMAFADIEIGRFCRFQPPHVNSNEIMLRTYSGLVSLTNPRNMWTGPISGLFTVLPEDFSVEVVSGNLGISSY